MPSVKWMIEIHSLSGGEERGSVFLLVGGVLRPSNQPKMHIRASDNEKAVGFNARGKTGCTGLIDI
jgi:hypothetical protein